MRSPGEIQIWREENRFQWEDTEFEVAECGPHGDTQETSGNPGLETWGSHHGITIIPGIPAFTRTMQTYSEELASLEIHGMGGSVSPAPYHCTHTNSHVSEPSSRTVTPKKEPSSEND